MLSDPRRDTNRGLVKEKNQSVSTVEKGTKHWQSNVKYERTLLNANGRKLGTDRETDRDPEAETKPVQLREWREPLLQTERKPTPEEDQ